LDQASVKPVVLANFTIEFQHSLAYIHNGDIGTRSGIKSTVPATPRSQAEYAPATNTSSQPAAAIDDLKGTF
jgi:hypothetical protein